jgi:predicted RNA-binding Zn-ribbon protein involved in translation (DUF1610 family)
MWPEIECTFAEAAAKLVFSFLEPATAMVHAFPQKTLKVVPAPLVPDAVDNAPPVLEARTPTVEYTCGNCGAVLMRVNENNKVHALIVHCTSCDTYNSTHLE